MQSKNQLHRGHDSQETRYETKSGRGLCQQYLQAMLVHWLSFRVKHSVRPERIWRCIRGCARLVCALVELPVLVLLTSVLGRMGIKLHSVTWLALLASAQNELTRRAKRAMGYWRFEIFRARKASTFS